MCLENIIDDSYKKYIFSAFRNETVVLNERFYLEIGHN